MLLASEAGELVAEYRWVRGEVADAHSHEPPARARIAAEIADVGIALVLLCDRIGVDLAQAMADSSPKSQRYPSPPRAAGPTAPTARDAPSARQGLRGS